MKRRPSLAVAAIGTGDRVGLIDLSAYAGVVPAGGGKRHLERILRRIALSRPSGTPISRRRAPIVPPGAIVYLLSAFLDDDVTDIAMFWRAAGHRVIAVDVLPTPLLDRTKQYTRIAHRIVLAERRRRIADTHANGAELFRWQKMPINRPVSWRSAHSPTQDGGGDDREAATIGAGRRPR